MTALSIQPTYPIFTDIDGQPLEDGYVWIGVANLAPIGNPINVYWDAALTIPATQPIRTRGGYPMNSGTPARMYVNSDYSIQVQNKNGSVVYSAPTPTERISSGLLTFIQSGAGAVNRTVESKLRDSVSVEDFGAIGNGLADDTQAFINALNSGAHTVFALKGPYLIGQNILMPINTFLIGGGINGTNLICGADVVPITMQYYCKVQGFKITFSGVHTKNGIDVGTNLLDAGRSVIQDVWVEGAGNDGIQVRKGNLGSIRDVVVTSCGRDGINFTLETIDNNAWTLDGYVDIRGNTRDGVHFAQGSSSGDLYASKSHSINLLIAQQNGRYGLYVGTRSNAIVVYGEANGPNPLAPTDIFLDVHADGNEVTIVEGYYTNNSDGTILTYHNIDAGYLRGFRGATRFEGGLGKGIIVDNSDGVPGQLRIQKSGSSTYRFSGGNTSQTAFFNFTNEDPAQIAYANINGDIDLRNVFIRDGVDFGRIKFNNINQIGSLNIYKNGDRTYYFQTSNTAGTSEVNFDTNDGPTNWFFRGFTMPKVDDVFNLGNAGNRWAQVWAGNGTIQTSDGREKQQVSPIDDAVLRAWAKVEYCQFKFNSSVEKKGNDNARIHIGLIAQRVKEAFESEGLDAFKYGLLCYDEFEAQYEDVFADVEVEYPLENGDVKVEIERRPTGEKRLIRAAGNRYGLRYEQALALECAYLRSQIGKV